MTQELPQMTSHRPYLLRALVEWINDNGMTPHLFVDAGISDVRVPASAIKDGRVVLNIAERAVVNLRIDNDGIRFTARFGGVSYPVQVPMAAVLAVYARENGQGMALPEEIPGAAASPSKPSSSAPADGPDDGGGSEPAPPGKRSHLRIVK